ncbi:hypothetical protein U1Q18_047338 [Sarracenia purpurea var. burkii]
MFAFASAVGAAVVCSLRNEEFVYFKGATFEPWMSPLESCTDKDWGVGADGRVQELDPMKLCVSPSPSKCRSERASPVAEKHLHAL